MKINHRFSYTEGGALLCEVIQIEFSSEIGMIKQH